VVPTTSAGQAVPLSRLLRLSPPPSTIAYSDGSYRNTGDPFLRSIPAGAAINEGVELAKLLSTEDSGRFVNGLLGYSAARPRTRSGLGGTSAEEYLERMIQKPKCVTCSDEITQVSIEGRSDVWVHVESGDWITWKCPTSRWKGGLFGWWESDEEPACPQCGEQVLEDHQAEKSRLLAAGYRINNFITKFPPTPCS